MQLFTAHSRYADPWQSTYADLHFPPMPVQMTADSLLLSASDLSFCRNDVPIFGPLDFRLSAGECMLVSGDNGSGKTSLLRVLAGVMVPTAGTASCRGGNGPNAIAWLGHQLALKNELTVLENLSFRAALSGNRNQFELEEILARFSLLASADSLVGKLSAGQRKKTALIGIALSPARVWLLDEPYANLDARAQALFDQMLARHCSSGGCAIITSHQPPSNAVANMRVLHLPTR